LRRHPQFLQQYPDLALSLELPKDSGKTASLASYQLDVLRDKNRELNRRLNELFTNAQENERLTVRTHQLTLALLRAHNPLQTLQSMVACLSEDFQGDAISVVITAPMQVDETPSWLQLMPGSDAKLKPFEDFLKNDEPICGRLNPDKIAVLFGSDNEAAASVALLPIKQFGFLAVGSRDANRFYPGMGTLFLRLMGEALSAALARNSA
jgi:uncharacterized protein